MLSTNKSALQDKLVVDIANYAFDYKIESVEAYHIARYCVIDALGCALESLHFPACIRFVTSLAQGIGFRHGVRVPGTRLELDPVNAAFAIGAMVRWLDFNDALAALQGGHPSDNLGAIVSVADFLSRKRLAEGGQPLVMRDVLTAQIKAYEIQGLLSLDNNLTGLGYDHVTLVRVASTAVTTQMLGGNREAIAHAVSNAWADGVNLNIYRQGASTGSRKSWAGGDATSRAVRLALLAVGGEMGPPAVLTAKTFGFYDVFLRGQPLKLQRPYASHVIENALAFKFVPAGMQGQSAAECAFRLHPLVKDRLHDIDVITIKSHQRMMRIMDKQGPLSNPADRDHCVQYLVAVGLIHGKVGATDFEDYFAADPRIDRLRAKMTVIEEPRYTREFHDPAKHSNAHALEIRFKDGSHTPEIEIEFPSGHPPLRKEDFAKVEQKFSRHMEPHFAAKRQAEILDICASQARLESTPVNEFLDCFVI